MRCTIYASSCVQMPWKTYTFPEAVSSHAAVGGAERSEFHKTLLLCVILLLTLLAVLYFAVSS